MGVVSVRWISIHAPHAGRDVLEKEVLIMSNNAFQSTRPMRGATVRMEDTNFIYKFQSTRPMRGATKDMIWNMRRRKFQSTRPMRGATASAATSPTIAMISIHAPHAGRDD